MTDTARVHEKYTEGSLLSREAASLRSQAAVTRHPPYCPCLPPLAVSPAPGAVDPSIQVSSGDYGPYRPPRRSRRVGAPDFAPTMTCWTTPVPPAPTASFRIPASAGRRLDAHGEKISDTTAFKATAFETSQWLPRPVRRPRVLRGADLSRPPRLSGPQPPSASHRRRRPIRRSVDPSIRRCRAVVCLTPLDVRRIGLA